MSFRRNRATVIKCLVVLILLLVAIPFLLRSSLSSGDGEQKLNTIITGKSARVAAPAFDPQSGPVQLVDWHDRDAMEREKKRSGPGEGGSAYILTAEEEKLKSPLYQVNGFNALASDRIALD